MSRREKLARLGPPANPTVARAMMKTRVNAVANVVDFGAAALFALWQFASVVPACRSWSIGNRSSAVLDVLFPTMMLFSQLLAAARARSRSAGWGLLAIVGPIGVAFVYRWPLLPPPEVPPGTGFQPNGLAVVFPVVQLILALHTSLTYPWDRPHQWVDDLGLYLLVSVFTVAWAGQVATQRGWSRGWGVLGLLGPVGLPVPYCLPDRTIRPARGFPITPVSNQP